MDQSILINGYIQEHVIKASDNRRLLSCVKNNKRYALKEFSKENYHQYHQEVYIIKQLKQHQNIIKLEGNFQEGDKKYIVLQYCHKDLKTFLIENVQLSQMERFLIFAQIVSAFKSIYDDLSKKGFHFQHRDIKPENFMLGEDKYIKIIDYGESRLNDEYDEIYQIIRLQTQIFGTLDTWILQWFQNKSDIWSLGATLYYLMTNKLMEFERNSLAIKINKNDLPKCELKKVKDGQEINHQDCKKLLHYMLNMDIEKDTGGKNFSMINLFYNLLITITNHNDEVITSRKRQAPADEEYQSNIYS